MSALQCRRASKIRHLNRFGVQVEQKVTPPETRDLGNGRRGFTRQGINNMLDGMVGKKIPIPTKEDLRF